MTNNIDLDKGFFFGGKAIFTVESSKSGMWRTFKVKKTKPTERYPNPNWLVFVLAGPDNETSYAYIGVVNPNTGEFRLTGKSKRNEQSPDVTIFRWLMRGIFERGMTLENGVVHHEGKCGCCGRKLTVPESIKRGIGPECWSKMGGA